MAMQENSFVIRRIAIFLILLTAIFFGVGWALVKAGSIEKSTYVNLAGIVGGVASVIGLIGLVRPPLTRRDFEGVEWESLAKIAETEKQLAALDGKKAQAHSELQQLTRTREELADLVKRASTVLFLREELDRSAEFIVTFLDKNPDLRKQLENHRENTRRLKSLNEELSAHPDVALIADVLSRVRIRGAIRRKELMQTLDQIPLLGPILKLTILILDSYAQAVRILLRRPKG
jgi:hypothetical protein